MKSILCSWPLPALIPTGLNPQSWRAIHTWEGEQRTLIPITIPSFLTDGAQRPWHTLHQIPVAGGDTMMAPAQALLVHEAAGSMGARLRWLQGQELKGILPCWYGHPHSCVSSSQCSQLRRVGNSGAKQEHTLAVQFPQKGWMVLVQL